uniref:Ovule protein n=1 Tax=Heterorhabditis bacteriophora TaxID=37862 RepID=A0A1I7X4S9_HETBA
MLIHCKIGKQQIRQIMNYLTIPTSSLSKHTAILIFGSFIQESSFTELIRPFIAVYVPTRLSRRAPLINSSCIPVIRLNNKNDYVKSNNYTLTSLG